MKLMLGELLIPLKIVVQLIFIGWFVCAQYRGPDCVYRKVHSSSQTYVVGPGNALHFTNEETGL